VVLPLFLVDYNFAKVGLLCFLVGYHLFLAFQELPTVGLEQFLVGFKTFLVGLA
jgi:hypothetical protein